MLSERARVLITVKASPEPSKTYGDTVCVAGIRLNDDGTGSWVRIYPVAFRHLDSAQQFAKFEVIDVDLTRATRDSRLESHRPNWETLSRQMTKNGKYKTYPNDARGPILEQLLGPTMCELRDGVDADLNAQSLGLVEVRELKPLRFAEHGPWTAKQIDDMKAAMQPDIFGDVDETPMLIPPRFKVHYDYYCMTPSCKGHKPRILDIELSALQYRSRFTSDEELKALITQKFHTEMWNDNVRTYFFVGNFADIVKRKNFSVLGVYKPPRASAYADVLF